MNAKPSVCQVAPMDGPSHVLSRAGWLGRLAWLPVPILLAAMVVLWVADLRTPYESAHLILALNFVFSLLVSLFIAHLDRAELPGPQCVGTLDARLPAW